MNSTLQWVFKAFGWLWVFIFVMIGILGAGVHILDHYYLVADRPAVANVLQNDIYGKEFFIHWLSFRGHPESRLTHMFLGIAFVVIAPWQFVSRIRRHHVKLHRAIGITSVILSFILIYTGLIFTFKYTYTGFVEQAPTVTYSLIFTWIVLMGWKSIKERNFAKHREWAIRGFSMMMGISATRVWFYLFLKLSGLPSNQFFSTIFWLGLGVNLLIGEIWINLTRPRDRKEVVLRDHATAARDFQISGRPGQEQPAGAG
ncbi:MAG: DUF2306 domain-containing protein [Methanothrix sp.]|nr:DUF2306 domain-containing protein [Methanothrix sp.]